MSNVLVQQAMAYGSLSAVLLMLSFGVWVAVEGRGSDRHSAFAGVIMSVALWTMTYAIWRLPTPVGQSVFWFRTLFFIGSLIPAFYYIFSLTYLMPVRLPRFVWALSLLPNLIILYLVYFTETLVKTTRYGVQTVGDGRGIFALHFSLFVVAALSVLLYASRKRKDKLNKNELFPVIAGAIIAFYSMFGVMFGPTMGQDSSFVLTVLSLVGGTLIIVPFIIKQRMLVDLRLVGVELLILIALFIFIVDIVVSANDPFDFAFRLAVLVLLIFYGVMTTRVFVREMRQLQENEVMQRQIIDMNGRLIKADRLKTKFVSLVAHQLRAPLTSIHIYLDMALKGDFGPVPEKLQPVLESNQRAAERLIVTTQTFLDVARIETGSIDMYRTDTDINALIDRLVEETKPMVVDKGLDIRCYVTPNLPKVYCDAGVIYHVLMNFVDNAVKYSEMGDIIITVKVDEKNLEVMVTDSGIGMTEEDKEAVFHIFERGMSAVKLESRGEGLGMFIAKQFIDAHGGELIVESKGEGLGSTFGFRIPIEGNE